jgi:periplasmic protein TonB
MSDLGNLSQCMMDSDAAGNGRAKRLRGKAVAASLVLEAVVIAGVLLWPLATLGVLPAQMVLTPVPPYHGAQVSRPAPPGQTVPSTSHRASITDHIFQQPPNIPRHTATGPDPAAPNIDGNSDPFAQPGSVAWLPGGNDRGPGFEIARPETKGKPRMVSMEMDASLIHRVQPEYPRIATAMRLSGTVLLRAVIGTDGEVYDVEVLSGNQILAQAACAAVRQWRYRPTLLNGQPVEVETRVTVNFVLN